MQVVLFNLSCDRKILCRSRNGVVNCTGQKCGYAVGLSAFVALLYVWASPLGPFEK